jgi:hypothetical protein
MTLMASPSWFWIVEGTEIMRPITSRLMAVTSSWGSL